MRRFDLSERMSEMITGIDLARGKISNDSKISVLLVLLPTYVKLIFSLRISILPLLYIFFLFSL